MRLLQICNRVPYPLVDGGAIAMFAMTKSLAQAGVEVVTLAINTKKHYVDPTTLPEWFSNYTQLHTVDADTDVKALAAFGNLFSKKSYNLIRFDIPEFHEKLKKLLRTFEFDVVQLEGLFLSMYIPTIRSHSKAIISLRAHNVEYMIWRRMAEHTSSLPKKWYLNLLANRLEKEETLAFKTVDCIIPISTIDEENIIKHGIKCPMLVCTAGVDENLFQLQSNNNNQNSLFHLAAMNWQPNLQAVDWLVTAIWPRLKSKFPQLKLHLAGKDMPTDYFKNQDNQLFVEGRVENAVDYMLSKQIMLVPLLSGSGMRIKIIEGLALGKIIVSTSIGAEGISYQHKKNILIANSTEEFVECISWVLQHPVEAESIGVEARKLASSQYSNKAIVGRLIHFYNNLIPK